MAFDLLGSIGSVGLATATVHAMNSSQHLSSLFPRLVLLGQIGYVLELALATAATVLGGVCVFRCMALVPHVCGAAAVDCNCCLPNDLYEMGEGNDDSEEAVIKIRLDAGFVRFLRRHRCVVTIHRLTAGVQVTGRETWYARHVRNAWAAREPKEHPAAIAGKFGTQGGTWR